MMKRTLFSALAIGLSVLAGPVAVNGQSPKLALLNQLDRGLWELKSRQDDIPVRRICLGDPQQLIQLQHGGLNCSSYVVSDTPADVTVQYTCRGHGYGRTHIRRETSQLIQLDTQGIDNGAPYAFAAEGRRVGACKG